ncbi:MAG: hypothetical protein R3F50_02585 [Gammaproteobacteria bacterium]
MKQSESDKLLHRLLREQSARRGWRFSRGFIYKKEGDLYFTIIVGGQLKAKTLHWSMTFKHYDFDDIFWEIVQLPENKVTPLSFRACGAWVAPSMDVQRGTITLDQWDEATLSEEVSTIFELLDPISVELANTATSYKANLQLLESFYSQLIKQYPNAIRDLWVEKLLTCLLESEFDEAKKIAVNRSEAGDSGGFNYAGRSFYQLAIEYIDAINNQ